MNAKKGDPANRYRLRYFHNSDLGLRYPGTTTFGWPTRAAADAVRRPMAAADQVEIVDTQPSAPPPQPHATRSGS